VGQVISENNSNIVFNQNCGTIPPSSPSSSSSTIRYVIMGFIFVIAALAGLIASGIIII
jgi:hypothetical protein